MFGQLNFKEIIVLWENDFGTTLVLLRDILTIILNHNIASMDIVEPLS